MSNSKTSDRRIKYLGLFFSTAILFSILYGYTFDKKLDLNGDNANYYMLGKALSEGRGFVNINTLNLSPNNHFPPGYPFIISLVMRIVNEDFTTLKIINAGLFFASLIVLFLIFEKITKSTVLSVFPIIFLVFNSHFLRYATMIMTEIPFLFFSSLTLYLFLNTTEKKGFLRNPNFYGSLLLIAASYYIKTSAIAILGGMVLYLLWKRRWKTSIAYIFGFVALISPWIIRGHQLGGNSYLKQLLMINPYRPEMGQAGAGDFVERFFNNIGRYISKEIPSANFSFITINYREASSLGMWILGLTLIALIIYGIIKLPNYRILIGSYLLGTFGILFLWPDVWVGVRFLLPAVPFLLLALFSGFFGLLDAWVPRYKSILRWSPLALLLLFVPALSKAHGTSTKPYSSNWNNYFALAKWIRDNAPGEETVVACRKPTMFYLFSHTYTVNYKYTENQQEFLDNLYRKKVKYVVYDQLGYSSTYRYLRPVIQQHTDRFKLIRQTENPPTYLFEFDYTPESK